jgi:hypothetical protein
MIITPCGFELDWQTNETCLDNPMLLALCASVQASLMKICLDKMQTIFLELYRS